MPVEYKLRILNLKCYLSDEAGGDEVYLKSEMDKIWMTDQKFIHIMAKETAIGLDFNVRKGKRMAIEL